MKFFKKPTNPEAYPLVDFEQKGFQALYKDTPGSKIPNNALARAVNVLQFDEWFEIRPGTKLWSDTPLPTLEGEFEGQSQYASPQSNLPHIKGRNNYVATKTGNIITKTVGEDFTAADVGNYFVWPGNKHDRISEFIDANRVRTRIADVRQAATAVNPGKIRGPINDWMWHKVSRKVYWYIGNQVFWTDYLCAVFHEIHNRSNTPLPNEKSTLNGEKDKVYIFTSAGHYQIDTATDPIEFYRINDEIPSNNIQGKPKTKSRVYGRRYIYTMSRLSGTGNRDRGDEGVQIKKESGPTKVVKSNNYNDYKEVFWDNQIIDNVQVNKVLRGRYGGVPGDLSNFNLIDEPLQGIAVRMLTYRTGGITAWRDIAVDIRNVESFDEIAAIIQAKMREVFSDFTPYCVCRFANNRFEFHAGAEDDLDGADDSWIDIWQPVGAGIFDLYEVGTNDYLNMPGGAEFIDSTAHILEGEDESDNALMIPGNQKQWTHYTVYTTQNTNDPINNPELYIFLNDVHVAKSFICNYRFGGPYAGWPANGQYVYLEITDGSNKFEREDIGSFVKTTLGITMEIIGFISENEVVVGSQVGLGLAPNPTRVWPNHPFPHSGEELNIGCAIGGGNVCKATQAGTTVTRDSGTVFAPDIIGSTLFWSDGTYGYVTEFVDEDTVYTETAAEHDIGGLTWNPTGRNFNDTISDTSLGYRAKTLPLQNRFWTPLPNGRIGEKVPGFIFVAEDNGDKVSYSQLPLNSDHLGGHYYPEYQTQPVKDAIKDLWEFPGLLIIFCANSTWRIQTNVTDIVTTPSVGEAIAVITGVSIVDGSIGIKHEGSIQEIDGGAVILVTSEPQVRKFNGYQYSEGLATDEKGKGYILEDIQKLQPEVAVGYDPLMGYIIWGTEESY